jgi:formate hydrogenlyase subunit 3/multisubunit Na+/H+ antiporter MnhD subunit
VTGPALDTAWAAWLVSIPVAAALVAFVLPRIAGAVAILNAAVMLAGSLALLGTVTRGPVRYALGGWDAPLGINLYADPLSALLVLVASIVLAVTVAYSRAYLAGARNAPLFWPIFLFLNAALNAVLLSADAFNLYVSLELLCLSAVALVALADDPPAMSAALRYLLASIVASLAYLLGVSLLYHAHGALDLGELGRRATWEPATWAALGLMTTGLALKGALFPVHFWLPRAHAYAPSPVSALLSALVVKAPFYVLLRLWFAPFAGAPASIADLLGGLGAVAILWGSLQALRQERLKLLVAYSTVAQVGYLFLLFPLAQARSAVQGVTIFIIGHALAKAGMFLAAGNMQRSLGHDRIRDLHLVARDLPITVAAFGLAGVCIMGLPPSANFIGKWLLVEAAFAQGDWGWAVVVVGGGLLSAAYVFRVLGHAFRVDPAPGRAPPVAAPMAWGAFLLSVLALTLGLAAAPLIDLIGGAVEVAAVGHAR